MIVVGFLADFLLSGNWPKSYNLISNEIVLFTNQCHVTMIISNRSFGISLAKIYLVDDIQ